jgi:hypothetical protein
VHWEEDGFMTKQPYWFMAAAIAIAAVIGATIATVRHNTLPTSTSEPATVSEAPSPIDLSVASPTASPQDEPATNSPTTSETPTAPARERLTANSKLTVNGLGPIRVGMTVDEAIRAAGVPLESSGDEASPGCEFYEPKDNSANIAFMVVDGRVVRADAWRGSPVTTPSGLGIGSTEAQIQAKFPGQIELEPHEYIEGNYVIFVPKDASDRNYRIVFETDAAGRVLQLRSGKLPEVMWVEGCA